MTWDYRNKFETAKKEKPFNLSSFIGGVVTGFYLVFFIWWILFWFFRIDIL